MKTNDEIVDECTKEYKDLKEVFAKNGSLTQDQNGKFIAVTNRLFLHFEENGDREAAFFCAERYT